MKRYFFSALALSVALSSIAPAATAIEAKPLSVTQQLNAIETSEAKDSISRDKFFIFKRRGHHGHRRHHGHHPYHHHRYHH